MTNEEKCAASHKVTARLMSRRPWSSPPEKQARSGQIKSDWNIIVLPVGIELLSLYLLRLYKLTNQNLRYDTTIYHPPKADSSKKLNQRLSFNLKGNKTIVRFQKKQFDWIKMFTLLSQMFLDCRRFSCWAHPFTDSGPLRQSLA